MNPLTQNRMVDQTAEIASDFWSRQAQARRVLAEIRRADRGDMLRGVIYVVAMFLVTRPVDYEKAAYHVLPVFAATLIAVYITNRLVFNAYALATRTYYSNLPRDARLTRSVQIGVIAGYSLVLGLVSLLGSFLGWGLFNPENTNPFPIWMALLPLVSSLIWYGAISCVSKLRPAWIILAVTCLTVVTILCFVKANIIFSKMIIILVFSILCRSALNEFIEKRRL